MSDSTKTVQASLTSFAHSNLRAVAKDFGTTVRCLLNEVAEHVCSGEDLAQLAELLKDELVPSQQGKGERNGAMKAQLAANQVRIAELEAMVASQS